MNKEIKTYLETHEINYSLHTHPPVFTCEEADIHCKDVPGLPGKNLFLRDKKTDVFFLVVMPASKRLRINDLGKSLHLKKLTFGTPEQLKERLNVEPGSVSPFGLIFDPHQEVTLLIDEDMWNADIVNFHPNDNAASLELSKENFHKFIDSLPHHEGLITIPE